MSEQAQKVAEFFKVLGYYEDIIDADTLKCIGSRSFLGQDTLQPYGVKGRVEHVFIKGENITLDAAHKGTRLHRFSDTTLCFIETGALCGRMTPKAIA